MPASRPSATRLRAYERVARLILAGRMGRATRELARFAHGTPLALKSDAERRAWAEEVLALKAGEA
ncbi:MAG: hypothetical protein IPK12_23545 [Gemmatimonadetes bacterium]|nr:hypothetical protein [Gemmatimonadota bacterium]